MDIKRLYEKHVLPEYGKLYQSFTKQILICNGLQVVVVKICLRVSHGKALPLILEIAEEFWPWYKAILHSKKHVLCYMNHEARDERVLFFFYEWYFSVLEALLFSIYINNLQSVECSTICNVDDTIKFSPLQWRNLVPPRIKSLMTYNESMIGALNPDNHGFQQSTWWFVNLWTLIPSFLDKELLPTDSIKDLGVIFDPIGGFHCDVIKL